jgi:hypothetical protein
MSREAAIRQAKRFYGSKTCVVTGRSEHNHWHHLDENHKNWVAANILPVSPNINHDIEQLRKNSSSPLSTVISPEYLNLRAREHWAYGRFACCYGCGRLGSFIALKHCKDPDLAVQLSTGALQALRPLANNYYAEDTLHRTLLPVVWHRNSFWRVRAETWLALCKEIASYFLDHGSYQEFFSWIWLAQQVVASRKAENTVSLELSQARLSQHIALARIERSEWDARNLLAEANAIMMDLNYTFGLTTNAQHLSLSYLRQGKVEQAEAVIEETCRRFGEIEILADVGTPFHLGKYSSWTYSRLLLVRAQLELAKGVKSSAFEYVNGALDVIAARRILALGATTFDALWRYFNKYPHDRRRIESQTGEAVSATYKNLTSEIYKLLHRRLVYGDIT